MEDLLAHQEILGHLAQKEPKESLVFKEMLVIKVSKVYQELKVLQAL